MYYYISSKSHCSEIKAPFDATTIRGQLGHVQRSTHTHAYLASTISLFVSMYNVHTHSCIAVGPLHVYIGARSRGQHLLGRVGRNMRQNLEGSKIMKCAEISRKYGTCSLLTVTNPIHMPSLLYMLALGETVEEIYVWDHDMSVWWPLPTNKHHKVRWSPQFLWLPFDG